jgi:hypothetical protein
MGEVCLGHHYALFLSVGEIPQTKQNQNAVLQTDFCFWKLFHHHTCLSAIATNIKLAVNSHVICPQESFLLGGNGMLLSLLTLAMRDVGKVLTLIQPFQDKLERSS